MTNITINLQLTRQIGARASILYSILLSDANGEPVSRMMPKEMARLLGCELSTICELLKKLKAYNLVESLKFGKTQSAKRVNKILKNVDNKST